MQWMGRQGSSNVEDRRGMSGGMKMGGGIGTLIIILISLYFGIDPSQLLNSTGGGGGAALTSTQPRDPNAPADSESQFASVVLASTEQVWGAIFQKMGKNYEDPHMVLFTDRVQSACGFASAATGPFYCPADSKVYLDLSFFQELHHRFKAPGDFAQAYVIAHEVGHHVQNLLGNKSQIERNARRAGKTQANEFSVRMELQADFYAGVWAHYAQEMQKILDPGDIDEALNAATAIGDDKLEMQAQGYVVPESFTHGTSAQRARWFKKGFDTGDLNAGDTFNAREL